MTVCVDIYEENIQRDPSLRSDVSHSSEHGDTSMFKLCLATSLEVLDASIGCEPGRIPEPSRSLHAKLVFEGTQWRRSVVGPVTPGASSQAVLSETRKRPLQLLELLGTCLLYTSKDTAILQIELFKSYGHNKQALQLFRKVTNILSIVNRRSPTGDVSQYYLRVVLS